MKKIPGILFLLCSILSLFMSSCDDVKEHLAPAIRDDDSVSIMTTYGVNTLISDSGVIKYRIVAERWDVNMLKNPSKWTFDKGLFLEQFDEKFHVEGYLQCDTAYYYDRLKLWELRSRVVFRNTDGLVFRSQELFWDENKHELYSNKFSRVVTPERELQGTYFLSDEGMRHYKVSNSKGSMKRNPISDESDKNPKDTASQAPVPQRDQAKAKPKSPVPQNQ